jgi:hypothetical protein
MNRIVYLALLPLLLLISACEKTACYTDDDGLVQTAKLFSGCGQRTWRLTTFISKPNSDFLTLNPINQSKRFEYTLNGSKYREYVVGSRDTLVGEFQILDQGYAIRTRVKKRNGEFNSWGPAYLIQEAKENRIKVETSLEIRVLEPAN